MSIRNLEALFSPRSVAVIGVSPRADSLGAIVLRNLRAGGFQGPVWAVNRRPGEFDGMPLFAGVAALPSAPELAVICTPAETVPELVAELGRRGTRAAIVITAGLKQAAPGGTGTLEDAMLQAARPHLLRILGPNCLGLLVPGIGLNASFAPGNAAAGHVAFVSQSGALATAMLDWANGRGMGFSHFVSLGDSADVDFGDVLDYLASDAATRAILMYVESVKHARKFMSAARAAARNKPVILVKGGRAAAGARAVASHTGALAGSDEVFAAAVRRAGMLRVDTLAELFAAAETLAHPVRWRGERLAVLTNGGGAGVLAADALAGGGGTLAELAPATLAALGAALPASWSRGNPVDIIGDAPVDRYLAALRVLLDAPEIDGVLFLHAPTAIVPAAEIAAALAPVATAATKPVLSCWLGDRTVAPARALFAKAGLPSYATPEHAAAAWLQLVQFQRNQQALVEAAGTEDEATHPDAARILLEQVRHEGREWLDPAEAAAVLQVFGIPTVATVKAADAEAAARCADALGYPVALKLLSPQVVHKSDVGGVALDLGSAAEVRAAAARMQERLARERPDAQLRGFVVQAMARRPQAQEAILGIASDPVFGPVLLFGQGGTAVEVRPDRSLELPPVNAALARAMVGRTRLGALLCGFRGQPAANQEALVDAIVRVSRMASELEPLAELDINPLLVDAQGVLALDARIRVGPPGRVRPALRACPSGLEEACVLGTERLRIRPIRPDDGERLAAFYAGASAADLRLRFFHTRREVPRSELARYSHIDYEREITFIALAGEHMVAEVRAVCDPDNVTAEFAIQVAASHQRRGLGRSLLRKMLAYLGSRGTREVVGECLEENAGMLALARQEGFSVGPAEQGLVALRRTLAPPTGIEPVSSA